MLNEIKNIRNEIETQVAVASANLKSFPRGPNGLTPDAIKFSPEYRKVKNEFDVAFRKLRAINTMINKSENSARNAQRREVQQMKAQK